MASHVVVLDSAARRTTIKTSPNKHLSEVLEEACGKLGLNASQYGFKNNNKPVDLSRTIRLSGLSSGAKLELVQISKSAGVVSIALQLPQSEATTQAQAAPNNRLTDKFPSSTTLWLVLRKFEAGVAGNTGTARNFTARGVPSTTPSDGASGRLVYEQPVLQVMNRELSSFTDLQRSLAQLGLNSGTALIRLTFRPTTIPLEDAMAQIQGYFDSSDAPLALAAPTQAPAQTSAPQSPPAGDEPAPEAMSMPSDDSVPATSTQPEVSASAAARPVSVYRPPSSSTPSAALLSHNDADYTPTIEHAQAHQKLLQQNSRNVRLPTEAELAVRADEEAARWAAVKEVEIKVRFPDQSAVSTKFGQADSAADLYNFVRECLAEHWRGEAFFLRHPGSRGANEIIKDDAAKRLIAQLQFKGRLLVVFGWDEAQASVPARSTKAVLKADLQAQAQELKVREMAAAEDDSGDPGIKVHVGKSGDEAEKLDDGKKKLPKWLKGLTKK